ncbi:hypothetical protein, partial [Arcticibacter svalbardensis]
MLRHVNDWQHSGLSQIGYCQEKG